MDNKAMQIKSLLRSKGKDAPVMAKALKFIGDGSMEAGINEIADYSIQAGERRGIAIGLKAGERRGMVKGAIGGAIGTLTLITLTVVTIKLIQEKIKKNEELKEEGKAISKSLEEKSSGKTNEADHDFVE